MQALGIDIGGSLTRLSQLQSFSIKSAMSLMLIWILEQGIRLAVT